jgi:hypothetical protein
MKPFFIFLFLIPVALAVMPGEVVVSYENITRVTYPCYNVGNDVYLYANVSIGTHTCNITHWQEVQQSSGGGGGGNRRRIYKMEKTIIEEDKVITIPKDVVVKEPKKPVEAEVVDDTEEPIIIDPNQLDDATEVVDNQEDTEPEEPDEKIPVRWWTITIIILAWILLIGTTVWLIKLYWG